MTTLPPCPTLCDPDCEAECHEVHVPDHGNKRTHQPWACQGIREAILATATAIAQSLADPAAVEAMEEVSRKVMLAGINEVADEVMGRRLRELESAVRTSERKRITALAETFNATYDQVSPCDCGRTACAALVRSHVPFADLIREGP